MRSRLFRRRMNPNLGHERIQIRQTEAGLYYPVVIDLRGKERVRGPVCNSEAEADLARLTYRRTRAWTLS